MTVSAVGDSATASVVLDAMDNRVLYAKNADARRAMASTTKIMTAYLICLHADLEKTVSVTREMVAVEGTSMYLSVGDSVTFRQLLYGMLLSSGNDAANAAAIGLCGSLSAFVTLMNEEAVQLGLTATHFDTPSGLDGPTHYTTALDLARLTAKALQNEEFSAVCRTKSVTLTYGGKQHTLTNHNRLLSSYEGAIGVKTGYTDKAGRCLVSAAERNGHRLVCVTLNDRNDWADHKALLDYGFTLYDQIKAVIEGESLVLPIVSGQEKEVLLTCPDITLAGVRAEQVEKRVLAGRYGYAPIHAGDALGMVEYRVGDSVLARQYLTAQSDVLPAKQPTFISLLFNNVKKILHTI